MLGYGSVSAFHERPLLSIMAGILFFNILASACVRRVVLHEFWLEVFLFFGKPYVLKLKGHGVYQDLYPSVMVKLDRIAFELLPFSWVLGPVWGGLVINAAVFKEVENLDAR